VIGPPIVTDLDGQSCADAEMIAANKIKKGHSSHRGIMGMLRLIWLPQTRCARQIGRGKAASGRATVSDQPGSASVVLADTRNHRDIDAAGARNQRAHAADERDERAPPHSITSSARASSVAGMLRPSAFAVIRFTIRSNLVGCWTGRSVGLAPRRILST